MKNILALAAITTAISCTAENTAPTDTLQSADRLYINGVIWTGEEGAGDASVLAVSDNTIAYVGDDASVVDATETIDLAGRFMMAGFIDNHVHFLEGGAALASVDLRDAATPEEFSRRIIEYAATLPDGRWVLNGNWDHETWGGELPHRDWIDEGTGDTPVFVIRLDGHMGLANSAALALAGFTNETPTPEGGEIVRDANGDLTGVLKDTAMNMVFDVIPPASDDELLDAFNLAQSHALSLGITEVHHMSAHDTDLAPLKAFELAEESGALKIRIRAASPLVTWEDVQDRVADNDTPGSLIHWNSVKGFVDGSLGSTTAWFYEPYTDSPATSGFPLVDMNNLKSMMADADNAGIKLAIHGIGDRAIDELIAAMMEIAGDELPERRYRIEHFQHPSFSAIEAAAENRIIASMQPYHAIDDGRWAEKRIGAERIKTTYAFRTILDADGILSFGSDWPVAPLSPLDGVYAAVTRRTTDGANPDGWQPQEKISVEEALSAYTSTNAYVAFNEDIAGTLATGKRADLVILSDDPRSIDPAEIRNIDVHETVINGKTVFRDSGE